MNAAEIRERQRSAPDWLAVEMLTRIEALEQQVSELSKRRKPGRPRKDEAKNGTE